MAHTHRVEEDDPGDHAPVEPGQPLALMLACFVRDEEPENRQEEGVHGDVKDEFNELARALEGVKEDFVRGIKVNNPELQSKDGAQYQPDKGDRGEDQVLQLLIMRFRSLEGLRCIGKQGQLDQTHFECEVVKAHPYEDLAHGDEHLIDYAVQGDIGEDVVKKPK